MAYNFTADELLTAIKGSGAIMSTVAKRLGVDWTTAARYVNKWQKTRDAFADEEETILDMAEGVLLTSIKAGDTADAKWLHARRRRDKYAPRQEVTGADGEGLVLKLEWGDVADATD